MKIQIFDWCYDQLSASKSFISDSFAYASSKISDAYNVLPSLDSLSLNAKNFYNDLPGFISKDDFVQFIYGLHTPFDAPAIVETFTKGEKTRRVVGNALRLNLITSSNTTIREKSVPVPGYLPQVLLYGGFLLLLRNTTKLLHDWTIPDFENSSAEFALEWAAHLYFLTVAGRMLVANSFFNGDAAITVAEEHPNREFFPPCPCDKVTPKTIVDGSLIRGKIAKTQGNLASPAYYVSNIIQIWVVWCCFGPYVAWPLQALAYGYAFLEPNYSGMCTEHRYEELNKKNFYAFALGVMFLLWQMPIKLGRWYVGGGGTLGTFAEDIVFSLTYLYFIIAALSINRKIPENKRGIDWFRPGRWFMEGVLNNTFHWVGKLFENPEKPSKWVGRMQWLWETRPVQWVKDKLFGPYKNLESFSKTPEVKLTLDLRKQDIVDGVEWFQWVRSTRICQGVKVALPKVTERLPKKFRSPDLEKIVEVALNKPLDPWLQSVVSILTRMHVLSNPLDKNPMKIMDGKKSIELPAIEDYKHASKSYVVPLLESPAPRQLLTVECVNPKNSSDEFSDWQMVAYQNNSMFSGKKNPITQVPRHRANRFRTAKRF